VSPPDDVGGEMRGIPFDEEVLEALLSGRVAPEDAPPGLQRAAALIRAAKGPAAANELAGEHVLVPAVAKAVGVRPRLSSRPLARRPKMITKLLSAKAAAVAAAVVLSGGVAAAATGSLPAPVQSALSQGLSHVGISLPDPSAHGHGRGPSLPGPEAYGLCTAYFASTHRSATASAVATGTSTASSPAHASTAFSNLEAAAAAKGETVAQYCATVVRPGSGHGAPAGAGADHGKGRGEGHGRGTPVGVPSGPPTSVPVGGTSVPSSAATRSATASSATASTGVAGPGSTGPGSTTLAPPRSTPPVSVPASTAPAGRTNG